MDISELVIKDTWTGISCGTRIGTETQLLSTNSIVKVIYSLQRLEKNETKSRSHDIDYFLMFSYDVNVHVDDDDDEMK